MLSHKRFSFVRPVSYITVPSELMIGSNLFSDSYADSGAVRLLTERNVYFKIEAMNLAI
jgi:hypothetical protein